MHTCIDTQTMTYIHMYIKGSVPAEHLCIRCGEAILTRERGTVKAYNEVTPC